MGFGGSQTERIDIIDSYDPRVTGRAASKGTLFRYVSSAGVPILLIKTDDGFSTNWISAGGGGGGVYTASNVGVGTGVYKTTVANDFQFKTLVAGPNIIISTPTADEILISASGGGSVSGLPNTVAYFDLLGNLQSNVNARFNNANNSMALLDQPGVVAPLGSTSTIMASGDGTSTISVPTAGSFVHGFFQGSSIINATGNGVSVFGRGINSATLQAVSDGSSAFGYVSDLGSTIQAQGNGTLAFGRAETAGVITTVSSGALAFGNSLNNGLISAQGLSSLAFGSSNGSGIIRSSGSSSIAHGTVNLNSLIDSQGNGSLAQGEANSASQIIAGGSGCISSGAAFGGTTVTATGFATIAVASTNYGSTTISNNGAIAVGDNLFSTADYGASFGYSHQNTSMCALVIGRQYNTIGATNNNWINTDPLFVAGIGGGVAGYRLDKDGKVTTTASEVHSACRSVNSDTTLSARTDRSIFVDTATATGNVTITFPAGETGLEYYVKDSGNNATVNNVLFAATGPDTIEASADITNNRGTRHFQYFSGVWYVMNLP
jgi:hypothetical protein